MAVVAAVERRSKRLRDGGLCVRLSFLLGWGTGRGVWCVREQEQGGVSAQREWYCVIRVIELTQAVSFVGVPGPPAARRNRHLRT